MNVPNSIYGGDEEERNIYSAAVSLAAPSEIEFDFDDQIVNSRVYRRMLAQAMTKTMTSDVEVIEGDLISFADVATIKETAIQKEETSSAARLLEGLVISEQEQNVNNASEASHYYQRSAQETMDQRKWTKESIRVLSAAFPSGNYETWANCQVLLPQAREAINHVAEDEEDMLNQAKIAFSTGRYLYLRGEYKSAEKVFRISINAREKILGPEHPDTLTSATYLGSALKNQGENEEAQAIYQRVLKAREKVLGPEHPDTLTSVNHLGVVLESRGQVTLAEAMYQRALKAREKVLGLEHLDTLISVNNLGVVLRNQGEYKKAEATHRRALKAREKVLGPEHPDTIASVNNLGVVLWSQGEYKKAEAMHRRALKAREKVLGPEHPGTIGSVKNLGLVLGSLGKREEADALLRRALHGYEKLLGPEHPDTRYLNDRLNG
jgi:tetratricopeptide (TPR) repeat protein